MPRRAWVPRWVPLSSVVSLATIGCAPDPVVLKPAPKQEPYVAFEDTLFKEFPGVKRAVAIKATVKALTILGFNVVTDEPRIRTAPKAMAVGGTVYSRTVESFAWDISIEETPNGVKISPKPRGWVNGQAMTSFSPGWVGQAARQLYEEIEGILPRPKKPK